MRPSGTLFDEAFYIRINEARWAAAERLLAQVQGASTGPLTTCLDVGCGVGWFTERLGTRDLRVEGLDGRRSNIDEARRRVPGIVFHCLDIQDPNDTAGLPSYDLVVCFGLLYHTENPFQVVRNLRRLTSKVLLLESIVIPGASPTAWLVTESDNETQGLTTYALIPTRSCLLKMLEAAGFAYRYEYAASIAHDDFTESAARHRRRRFFAASTVPLRADQLVETAAVHAPKYDFTRR
jgi:SAM-dependent methyltransferase